MGCRLRSKGVMRYLNELTDGRNTSALFRNPLFFSFLSTPSKSCSEIFMPMGALVRASRKQGMQLDGHGMFERRPTTAGPAFYRHIQVPITIPSTLRT